MDNLQSGKRLIEFSFVKNIHSPILLDPSVLKDIEVIPEVEIIFLFKDSWVEEHDGEDWLLEYNLG